MKLFKKFKSKKCFNEFPTVGLLMTEICRLEEAECFPPGFMTAGRSTPCGEQFRQLLSEMTKAGIL